MTDENIVLHFDSDGLKEAEKRAKQVGRLADEAAKSAESADQGADDKEADRRLKRQQRAQERGRRARDRRRRAFVGVAARAASADVLARLGDVGGSFAGGNIGLATTDLVAEVASTVPILGPVVERLYQATIRPQMLAAIEREIAKRADVLNRRMDEIERSTLAFRLENDERLRQRLGDETRRQNRAIEDAVRSKRWSRSALYAGLE